MFRSISEGVIDSGYKAVLPEEHLIYPCILLPTPLEFKKGFDVLPDQKLNAGRKTVSRLESRSAVH